MARKTISLDSIETLQNSLVKGRVPINLIGVKSKIFTNQQEAYKNYKANLLLVDNDLSNELYESHIIWEVDKSLTIYVSYNTFTSNFIVQMGLWSTHNYRWLYREDVDMSNLESSLNEMNETLKRYLVVPTTWR